MQAKLTKRVWTGFLKIGERYVLIAAKFDLEIAPHLSPKLKTRKECKMKQCDLMLMYDTSVYSSRF